MTDRDVYERACKQMQVRLDLGGKAVVAQDFRHTVQGETELVADFVHQLERVFSSSVRCKHLPRTLWSCKK